MLKQDRQLNPRLFKSLMKLTFKDAHAYSFLAYNRHTLSHFVLFQNLFRKSRSTREDYFFFLKFLRAHSRLRVCVRVN